MVSDQELASCVESLLQQGFLSTITSVNDMVHQLEAKFGIDLSHKTSFIHEQINILLSPRLSHLPPTSSSERQHFSQISTGGFAAQMSQETLADATKELPEDQNHHQCLPPPPSVAAPAPDAKERSPLLFFWLVGKLGLLFFLNWKIYIHATFFTCLKS